MGASTSIPNVLSAADLETFRRAGFVRLPQAFSPALALTMQGEIWRELEREHGIHRDDRSTWRQLPHSPRAAKELPLNDLIAGDRFQGAISDLLGGDDWERPRTWGGFNVFFPQEPGTPLAVPTDAWHWDGPPDGRGLLVFSFYSSVRTRGGGTFLLEGSHRLIERFYASLSPEDRARKHKVHRKMLFRWDPWLEALTGDPEAENRVERFMARTTEVRGVPLRVVELTGEPGDAVFCNLGMLHALPVNRSDAPRFLRVKFLFLD